MPVIPKTSLPSMPDVVMHAPSQAGISMNWNAGNNPGSGIASGIGGIADAAQKIFAVKNRADKNRADADARLAEAEDDTNLRRYMVGYEDMQRNALAQMKDDPNGYEKFADMASERISDYSSQNEELYGKLSDKARDRLDIMLMDSKSKFMANVGSMMRQARITAGLNESNSWFKDQMDHGEYDRAEATARGQYDDGYIDRGTLESKLKQVNDSRNYSAGMEIAKADPAGMLAALDGDSVMDGMPELSDVARENLRKACASMVADNVSDLMDQIRSDVDDGGSRVTDDTVSLALSSGDITKKDADRLRAILKKNSIAMRRETTAAGSDSAKAKAADAARKWTEGYDSLLSEIATQRWPSSLEERKAIYADYQERAMEFYAADPQKGGSMLSLLKSMAYPDLPKDSEALAYYELAYGTPKTGYVGEKNASDSLYYVHDDKNRFWRNNRGNDDDAVAWMRGYVDKEARLWLQTNPDATTDDIDAYMQGLYDYAHSVSYDMMHQQTNQRWRSVSATEAKPATSYVGKDGVRNVKANGITLKYGESK